MERQENTKVAIDTKINEETSTVAVSSPPPPPPESKLSAKKQKGGILTFLFRGIVSFFLDFLETIVVALSIFVVIYLFIVQPHEVKGTSMEPNFHNNEYILTDKISYRFREPKRGEVVIFKAPLNQEVDYIKRVIGVPGDRIKVEKGFVYINGTQLDEPYLKDTTTLFPGSVMQEGVEITVGDDEIIGMGDNRSHSSDSREFGPVPKKLIIGRAFLRYFPLTVFGPIPNVSYQLDSF